MKSETKTGVVVWGIVLAFAVGVILVGLELNKVASLVGSAMDILC